MALLKRDQIVDDPWQQMDDESQLPSAIPVIVTYARWQKERDALLERNGELGIVLASDQSPDLIADDLHRFTLVCLDFPKFTDGRAYSHARRLRARLPDKIIVKHKDVAARSKDSDFYGVDTDSTA